MEYLVARFIVFYSNITLLMWADWRFIGLVCGTVGAGLVVLNNVLSLVNSWLDYREKQRSRREADRLIRMPTDEEVMKYGTPQEGEDRHLHCNNTLLCCALFATILFSNKFQERLAGWILLIFGVAVLAAMVSTVCLLYAKHIRYRP